jgi:hypothetical protein
VKRVPFVLAALSLAYCAQPASAEAWRQVTASGGGSTDQVSLARTPDGTLHVAWRNTQSTSADLLHTAITPAGTIGATTPIVSGWVGIQNPAIVYVGIGLVVFFGGQRSLDSSDPNRELQMADSIDNGASWTAAKGSIVPIGAQAYGSQVAATALPDNTLLQAWAGTLGTWVHRGFSPAAPNYDYQAPLGHYGYDVNIASDAAGRAVIAWYSNATGHLGVFAQDVDTGTGAPLGAATNMPGTGNMQVGMIGRTPLVARVGGGFYVAYATGYPALNRIRLWKVGAAGAALIASTNRTGNTTATLAAVARGRLWVAWTNVVGGSPHVFARRSNRSASVFGATVDAGAPKNTSSIYKLDANATAGALDVFGNTSIGISSTTATYFTRVLPGLTLTATPARLRRGTSTRVTFTVRDAGDPVAGARVSARGSSGRTDARGRVTLTLTGRGRSVAAHATKAGYVGADARLRVRPK